MEWGNNDNNTAPLPTNVSPPGVCRAEDAETGGWAREDDKRPLHGGARLARRKNRWTENGRGSGDNWVVSNGVGQGEGAP